MDYPKEFDVIVIGGGHAGTEASLASARLGKKTLLLTHNIETLGQMSCNPSIGGIGKGHLVKEIDAMGGIMGRAADFAGIQFRTLNSSKGPAVRATRAQSDRLLYKSYVRETLENQENLWIFQQAVDDVILKNQEIKANYLDHKSRYELLLYKAKGDYKRMYREKWEYYGGKADAKIYATKPFDLKVLKTDLAVYITSDEDIINAENKVGYLETVIDYIKGVIKSVDNRGWDIKNAIEWRKFEAGVTY